MHKTISTKVQDKTCFETKFNKVDQTSWFSNFYAFLDFWHKNRKRLIENNNVKTFKAKKKKKKKAEQTIQIANKSSVCFKLE